MLILPIIALSLSYIFYEKKLVRNIFNILALTSVFYIIIFRYGVGSDYFSYKAIYNSVTKTSFTIMAQKFDSIEIGYILIMLLFKYFGINYVLFSACISCFILIAFTYWISNYCKGRTLILSLIVSYSMFFLVWVLSAFRQGIVIAVLLLTVFNYKREMHILKKVTIVLLLSTIHYSSLIILLYLFLEHALTTKKSLVCFIVASLVISLFTPLITGSVVSLGLFNNVKFITKALSYFSDGGISYFAFAIRLLLVMYFIMQYDMFEKEKAPIFSIYKVFLIGNGIYMMIATLPLIASRLTIYSYIMVPLLLSKSIDLLSDNSILKLKKDSIEKLLFVTLLSFSFMFYIKEGLAYKEQSGYQGDILFDKIPTNKKADVYVFDNRYAFQDKIRTHFDNVNSIQNNNLAKYNYSEKDYFRTVWTKDGKQNIINQNGILVFEKGLSYRTEVYGDIFIKHGSIENSEYYRLESLNPNENRDLLEVLIDKKEEELDIKLQVLYIKQNLEYIDNSYIEIKKFLKEYEIEDFDIVKVKSFSQPLDYSIAELNIYGTSYYVLLNEDKKVVTKFIYTDYQPYDVNGFVQFSFEDYTHIYNKEGELIWIEK